MVEDANLTVAISQLRKALNENGDAAEFIQTIPRLGYRFVADLREFGGQDAVTGAEADVQWFGHRAEISDDPAGH